MVFDHQAEHPSQWAAISSIAAKIGCTAKTPRGWLRQAERDGGQRAGATSEDRDRVKALERAGFVVERVRGIHYFLRHQDGRATVVPLRTRTLGLELLRKILSDCAIKPEQINDLL